MVPFHSNLFTNGILNDNTMTRLQISLKALAATVLVASLSSAQEPIPGATPELNQNFKDPDVQQFVDRFESESREVSVHRDAIVELLELRPGMDVADVGAGTGLFTLPIAHAVGPEGAVYAVDIAPNFLQFIAERSSQAELRNVCTVLCTQNSAQLPPKSVDLVFICDTYHHFEDPAASLRSIRDALRPGGKLVVIDFDRVVGKSSEFLLNHVRADRKTFVQEIKSQGFQVIEVQPSPSLNGALKENFVAVFDIGEAR